LSSTQTFSPSAGLSTSQSLTSYTASSASWLDGEHQTASNDATYQSTLSTQASQALSNATGVNIDSQMSQMLDLENAYQASAKLISTINTMFSSLLQAVA
jgi:flagellar hook-associated protein 1 FlgK